MLQRHFLFTSGKEPLVHLAVEDDFLVCRQIDVFNVVVLVFVVVDAVEVIVAVSCRSGIFAIPAPPHGHLIKQRHPLKSRAAVFQWLFGVMTEHGFKLRYHLSNVFD